MAPTPAPEPLRRSVHQFVAETVANCQEVLRYFEPDLAHDTQRMSLYRATDAADTMNALSLLIAAYYQREGTSEQTLRSYLQPKQQRSRADGPGPEERAELASLLGDPAPESDASEPQVGFAWAQARAEAALAPEDDPQKLFTAACLHGLRARLSDDLDSLDTYLPPHVAALARKVAEALEEPPQPPA